MMREPSGSDPARFLPPALAEALGQAELNPRAVAEALVHITASRYAVGTYLPQQLLRRQLTGDSRVPWLEWIEGSLLFADISGSTALAERLSVLGHEGTELVTEFLNDFFADMIQVVHSHGGDLLNFGGDALLVLFRGDHHQHIAAQAALALQDRMHGFQCSVAGFGSFLLHMHIGVESGRLALASVGEPDSLRYVVLGEPVNGVALAEGYAQADEVVLGPFAWFAVAAVVDGYQVAEGYYRISAIPPIAITPLDELYTPDQENPLATMRMLAGELDLLTPYLPPGLLRRILLDPLRPLVEADLRPVTVLFAQVVGLGTLAHQLAPEQAAQVLQIYVLAMQSAIHRFGGVINKLDVADEGDKLLALFGAPLAYEDHAERAIRAALAMQEALTEVNQRIIAYRLQILDLEAHSAGQQADQEAIFNLQSSIFNQHVLRQRIGINTGTVFAGNVGTDDRKEYTVMGDAVNTAARVMARADWESIWVSPTALARAGQHFVSSDQGAFMLRGKSEPLHLYRLDGERTASSRHEAPRGVLVGRHDELIWLRERLLAAHEGSGCAVRIVGEAGLGKSRLTAELLAEAQALHMQVMSASCFSYTANIPYTPWAEWLKARCGIEVGDGPERRAELLARRLAELGPEMDEWLPLLAELVRIEVEETRLTRALDTRLRQERRFELLLGLILAAAAEQPLLLVIEDLHWADPISLDLWQQLALQSANQPLMLLGVHRPDIHWRDDSIDTAEVLRLEELSRNESYALIESLFGSALPQSLCDQLVERADGNPFYLEELLRALVERGLLVRRDDGYHAIGDLTHIELPDSLNGLLLARIDRLDESWRNLLRVASVIGQRFPKQVLQSVLKLDEERLLQVLTGLATQDLVQVERDAPERVDIFRHALIHEVTYQSLLYARRRELHERIGHYLESTYADRLDDFYGLLAHHYRLSDKRDKAITYLLKAGHAARAIFANEEAIQQYQWALEALGNVIHDQVWETRDALADALAVVGRYDEALEQCDTILAHVDALAPALHVEVRRKQGSVLEKQGRYTEALEVLRTVERLIEEHPAQMPVLALPNLCADLATVLLRQGDYDAAIATCERGLAAIQYDQRNREDELTEARLHATVGTIYGMRGDYSQARYHFERSLAARSAIEDTVGVVTCQNNLGYLAQLQSDYERALGHYQAAKEHAQPLGLRYALYFTYTNSAYAAYCLGRYNEAEQQAGEALELCRQMNNRSGRALVLDTLGLIHYSRGDYDQAIAAFDESLELHRSLGSSYQEGNTLAAGLALVYNALGQPTHGFELAQQALRRGYELQAQQLQLEALNASAESLLLLGEYIQAWNAAEQAAALARNLGNKSDRGVALRLLGQIADALHEPSDRFFAYSIRLAQEIKNPFELARAQVAYGTMLQRRGNLSGARAYLVAAQQTFTLLGSQGELLRLQQSMKKEV